MSPGEMKVRCAGFFEFVILSSLAGSALSLCQVLCCVAFAFSFIITEDTNAKVKVQLKSSNLA